MVLNLLNGAEQRAALTHIPREFSLVLAEREEAGHLQRVPGHPGFCGGPENREPVDVRCCEHADESPFFEHRRRGEMREPARVTLPLGGHREAHARGGQPEFWWRRERSGVRGCGGA